MMKNLLGQLEAAADRAMENEDRHTAGIGFVAQNHVSQLEGNIERVLAAYRYELDRASSQLDEIEDPLRAAEKLMELVQRMNSVPTLENLMSISARAIMAVAEAKEAGLLESLGDFIPNEA